MDRFTRTVAIWSILVAGSSADVAHFFPPDFGFFQHSHPAHHQQQYFLQTVQVPHPVLPSVYGPPPAQQPPADGHPTAEVSTPAPVAPVPPSSAPDFVLPEIVENRSAKDHRHFIPLSSFYLPPEDRPNYESPKPPNQGDGNNNDGYHYPRPPKPPATEAPNAIVVLDPSELLPPINKPTVDVEKPPNKVTQGYDYNAPSPVVGVAPSSTPAPSYLPPAPPRDLDQVLFENSTEYAGAPVRLQVKEMRCLKNAGAGYFRAQLKVDSFVGAAPRVDNDSGEQGCEVRLQNSLVIVDMAEESFRKCGVHACGKDLCLRLRFPAIRGLRTDTDAILTLHCRTQDRVAAKTHALKLGVSNDVQSRSIGTYARGGTQNQFRTHVELLRRRENAFTRHLETSGAVQLGEEILLRAHVLAGDGWNYTKLTDVKLQQISPAGEVLNSAQLITADGCTNPSMLGVCPRAAALDPPLGQKLAFKAIMFQGMRSGDELIVSMRITGCLEHRDCLVNTQECVSHKFGRHRRNAEKADAGESGHNSEMSEVSQISFRVVDTPHGDGDAYDDSTQLGGQVGAGDARGRQRSIVLIGSGLFVALLCGLGAFAALKLRR